MNISAKPLLPRLLVVVTLTFVYFMVFPADFANVLAPVERLLALSQSISPWLYGLIAVALVCATAVRIGARTTSTPPPTGP